MTKLDLQQIPRVDRLTTIGLALLLFPLLTMGHELLGHALTCVATGHRPSELGAFYVECPGTGFWSKKLVAVAGTSMDVILCIVGYLGWRASRRPLPRLVWWMVFTIKGLVAAGYWCFSGLTNLGDWGPNAGGGLAPMPFPWLVRGFLLIVGVLVYIAIVRASIRMLRQMLGGGEQAWRTQRNTALTLYLTGGAWAVLVGLLNPVGIFIMLGSAVASSFGGTAGLWNVAYARARDTAPVDFVVSRNWTILLVGIVLSVAFAVVLGPTIHLS